MTMRGTSRPANDHGTTDSAVLAERVPGRAALRPAAEDYLVGIALLAETGDEVTGTALATLLSVSPPSITQMLRRLAAEGLVASRSVRARAAGIALTPGGAGRAAWLLLRRRVCECLLIDGLGLDWVAAQAAADRMEHGLTAPMVRRLHALLGAPTRCPHGNPLQLEAAAARADGRGAAAAGPPSGGAALALAAAPVGAKLAVERLVSVAEHDMEALAYLDQHGIRPGQTVVVEGRLPQGDALLVRRGRRRLALAAALAARVLVRPQDAARQVTQATVPAAPPAPCRDPRRLRVTAVRVGGPCPSGHRTGDTFQLGHETPAGLCGASYAALFPCVQWLPAVTDSAPEADAPVVTFERRCPGDGYVTWRVEVAPAGGAVAGAPCSDTLAVS